VSALYAMNFVGMGGTGGGAVYVGNGKIVGIDAGNLRYSGTYIEEGGRMKGTVNLAERSSSASISRAFSMKARDCSGSSCICGRPKLVDSRRRASMAFSSACGDRGVWNFVTSGGPL